MASRPNNPLAKLKARASKTNAALIRALEQAKKDIAGDIARIAAKKDIAASAQTREELYAEVEARFKTLSDGIDAQLKELIEGVAKDTHGQAVEEIEAKGSDPVIRYDPARTKRYFDLVRPGNGKNLSAVFTDNMSAETIRQLRTSFVDVFRQGAVKGMTANDMQKALQQQWNEKAGDDNAFRFRDRSGRAWDNASYLQMLVRTNAQRVSIDAYTDTLTESGFNLAKISEDGDPDCPVCAAWEGRIIQLSGKSKKFPTLEEARAAGMFHPNCTHRPEYVDELFDADEIARQSKAGKPTPEQMADRKAMQGQKDAIDRSRYTDQGLTPANADRAVTVDRLERVIRAGTFSEEAAAAARALPPEALDAIRKGGIPGFQTVKKGEETGWRKGSAGGVVRVPRDPTAQDVLDALGSVGKSSERQNTANPESTKMEAKPSAKKVEEKNIKSDTLAAMKEKSEKKGDSVDPYIKKSEIDDAVRKAEKEIGLFRKAVSVAGPSDPDELAKGVKSVRAEIVIEKREHFAVLNGRGEEVFQRYKSGRLGGKLPKEWIGKMDGLTIVHNHPSDMGTGFGTSLSIDDVLTARSQALARIICVSPRRDYSLEPRGDDWPDSVKIYGAYKKAEATVLDRMRRRLRDGRVTPEQLNSLVDHMIWKTVAKQTDMAYTVTRHKE